MIFGEEAYAYPVCQSGDRRRTRIIIMRSREASNVLLAKHQRSYPSCVFVYLIRCQVEKDDGEVGDSSKVESYDDVMAGSSCTYCRIPRVSPIPMD